jgi:chromosome segregation ATPase
VAFAAVAGLAAGCVATTGDLDSLKHDLQRSLAEKTAPIGSLKADTTSKFGSLQNEMNKLSSSLAELQGRVKDLTDRTENLANERDKIQTFLHSANRRIASLFKSEETVLRDRMEFIRSIVKEFEAEELTKENASPKGDATPAPPRK